MSRQSLSQIAVELLDDERELNLGDLCRAVQLPAERVFELIDQGVIEPQGRDPSHWRFQGICVWRVRCAERLERDLGVNVAGAALALDLLEELHHLRRRLQRLEP